MAEVFAVVRFDAKWPGSDPSLGYTNYMLPFLRGVGHETHLLSAKGGILASVDS